MGFYDAMRKELERVGLVGSSVKTLAENWNFSKQKLIFRMLPLHEVKIIVQLKFPLVHSDSYILVYAVQPIISWIGRIVALLCITADTWRHEIVQCPFFSRPRKKQLRA
jgi:hypothetical protein